ncbi:protein translocase subunit SecF [Candidatus Woesearchaeota archaeon]|nr:protein translocase subunit SecF [Candidatus Woesearchaeota archaeon]
MEERKEEPKAEFSEVDEFLKEEEEAIETQEKKVEEELEKEEAKIEELEEKKQDIEEKKKAVEEKLKKEKQKAEELKKEEEYLEKAEKKTGELKEDIEKKRFEIKDSVEKIKKMFKPGKKEEAGPKKPFFKSLYEDNYKKLLIIPFLMLLLAVAQISYQYSTEGDFVHRGVHLKGGITLTIPEKTYDIVELEKILNTELGGDISVRRTSQTKGLLIEASDVGEEELITKVKEVIGDFDVDTEASIGRIGSSLGTSFFREISKAVIIAFVLMGIVVFVTFRVPSPSLAVILAALSDIIVTLAIFNLTGMKLGKGGIAAFLMLIGYSVDTDILLSTKVLKRKFGSVMSRVYSAMRTGLMMNTTTMAAIIVAMVLTTSDLIRQVMIILLIGLFVDIINTWIQNVGILRLYVERKQRRS